MADITFVVNSTTTGFTMLRNGKIISGVPTTSTATATAIKTATEVVTKHRTKRRKATTTTDVPSSKAAKLYNSSVVGGNSGGGNIVLVPSANSFDQLADDDEGDEVIMVETRPAKVRVPPITVFNKTRLEVIDVMKKTGIANYTIKNLRHAIHLYCNSSEDFKTVKTKLTEEKFNNYSHDLNEVKFFRVALKGLHSMDVTELEAELRTINLEPMNIRIIIPKNPRYTHDVVYIVSFKPGTIKLRDLQQKRTLCHTIVRWEPYQRKEGIVQCSRCQRPGHGARNCNMPPRCCLCGEGHETISCPTAGSRITNAMTTDDNVNNDLIEVKIPAKCCNCDKVGHFASDPKCPRKVAYQQARRKRTSDNRPDKKRNVPDAPTCKYAPGGTSYADLLRQGSYDSCPSGNAQTNPRVSPSGKASHSGAAGPSGTFNHSVKTFNSGPSGNANEKPFTMEEISSLTIDIVSSLRDVRHLPRHEAFMAVMNVAFKYLYRND